MSTLEGLRKNINSVLKLRDKLGVGKAAVYLVTQSWSGDQVGSGKMTEEKIQMLPTPYVFKFSATRKIPEGGAIKGGDILLRNVSMQSYPTEELIDGSSTAKNIEKLYEVDGNLYRVIEVEKQHVAWKVLLRRISKEKRS